MYNYNHLSISYICVALWHFPLTLAHSLHLSLSLSLYLYPSQFLYNITVAILVGALT